MSKRGFPARPGWAPCIFISLLITMTPDLARAHARRGVGSVGAAFGLLGQTKNGFGDRALTDTEAAFSFARNGQASQPSPGSSPHASCVAPSHASLRNKHQKHAR